MADSEALAFCWVHRFPMYQWDAETGRWDATHNPFSAPVPEHVGLLATSSGDLSRRSKEDPAGGALAQQYDVVLNGWELGGGSVRIHDRDLLDSSVNFILALENTKLTLYRGGYTAFEKLRNERLLLDQKMAKKQEAQRKHLQAFIDRFKAKATKARQAQSRVKMLEKMGPVTAMVTDDVTPIRIPEPEKLLSPPMTHASGLKA